MADTMNFMIFGFAVIFGTIGLHLWSLISRFSRLKKDMALMEDLEE